MNRRTLKLLTPAALAITLIAWYAGGWATITVEELPDYFVASKPTNVTFSIRQHGSDAELLNGLSPTIEAEAGKAEFRARAVQTNRRGYYTVTLDFPQPGEWTVAINSGFGRSRVKLLPVAVVGTNARPVAISNVQRGERLFVAKGCLVCHTHADVKDSGIAAVGPELTGRKYPTEYLEQWLANPKRKANSDKVMPNLNLKPAEIASLIAFINGAQTERQAAN